MVQNLATLDALLARGANVNVEGSSAHYSLLADMLSLVRVSDAVSDDLAAQFGIVLAVSVTPRWATSRTVGSSRSGPSSQNRQA